MPLDRPTKARASTMDAHVGSRIRLRRIVVGMSQQALGKALGLTFQQVQKYESGANRVGASRLFDLSCVLKVPVGFFFDALSADPAATFAVAEEQGEAVELVRSYYGIASPDARRRLLELVKSMSAADPDPAARQAGTSTASLPKAGLHV
jgi:transcriptional regulator with XRE-family HTH domain